MKPNIAGAAVGALALIAVAGGPLTATRVYASDGDGLSSFLQNFFASPQPANGAAPTSQTLPADIPRSATDRRSRLERARAGRGASSGADFAARKLKTRYVSLPNGEEVGREATRKSTDGRAAELAKAGEIQAALLLDKTLRAGDIVITAQGPKVFVGRDRDRHRLDDFEDTARSNRIDAKTRQLLTAMVAPRGALAADEARTLMAKLRRSPSLGRDTSLVSRPSTSAPRVISTALSQPVSPQIAIPPR